MKITLLLDYPEIAAPRFNANMELHGGKVQAVQFSNLFNEYETLESIASDLAEIGPNHQLFETRMNNLRNFLGIDAEDVDD